MRREPTPALLVMSERTCISATANHTVTFVCAVEPPTRFPARCSVLPLTAMAGLSEESSTVIAFALPLAAYDGAGAASIKTWAARTATNASRPQVWRRMARSELTGGILVVQRSAARTGRPYGARTLG